MATVPPEFWLRDPSRCWQYVAVYGAIATACCCVIGFLFVLGFACPRAQANSETCTISISVSFVAAFVLVLGVLFLACLSREQRTRCRCQAAPTEEEINTRLKRLV